MASFEECLDRAVSGGEISGDDAARLKADYKRLKAAHETGSSSTAEAEAKRALEDLLKAESDHAKRKAKLSIRSINRVAAEVMSHKDPRGRPDVATAALDMLEHFGTAGFSSVAGRARAITGMAHARMEEALHHFRRGAFGGDRTRWNRAQLDNVVRELHGEDTGDLAAKGLAKVWEETAEWLRRRFNAAGGAIGKIERWGLPQHHDARALRKAGRQAWKEAIRPRLDPARMRHPLTGRAPAEGELDAILDDIWDSIATEGWDERQPTRRRLGRGALANQRAEHRVLVFKDADSWLEYQRAFGGGGDAFGAMMGHINLMARDIGAMEILGPNPAGTVEWLKQAVRREAQMKAAGKPARFAGEGDPLDRAARIERRLDAVWRSLRGELNTPVSTRAANTLGAVRSLITASVLGQASISAITDLGFARAARRFAGLPQMGVVRDVVEAFRSGTRREAVESGLILDSAMHVFHTQARYVGTLQGPEWANYLADRVLTWSGLTPWTQAGRHAFGLAAMTEFGKRASMPYDRLPDALRNTLARYGLRARDWDMMRKAPLHRRREAAMLRPNEIAERVNPQLGERYLEMILAETEYAVPNTSHRSRTILVDQNQPGTLWGEALRSFAQFKSFGSAVLFLHGARSHSLLAQRETRMAGMAYAGSVLISTAMLGGLSLQLKQIVAGRDPRDMNPMTANGRSFYGAALLQGGGLGIYGDFLFSDINRYGGGFASTLAGPLVGRANDFWNLTAGNAVQLASGETTHFGRELVRFARGNVPGGNIWYLKLAAERLLFDQLAWLADPEAQKAFKRQEQYWRRATGQEYFWRPGQTRPERGPRLAPAEPAAP